MKWLTAIALVSATVAACEKQPAAVAPKPRNLVLITFDTCRPDRMTPYGYDRDTTPNVAALADKSVVFENAYSQAASTSPSFASIMTSKYVHNHGVLDNYLYALSEDEVTLAERLQAAGLETAAFIGIGILMPVKKLNQGFSTYSFTQYKKGEHWKPATQVTDEALAWLESNYESPFFLWVHYFEPHFPYTVVPQEWRTRFVDEPHSSPLLAKPGMRPPHIASIKKRLDEYDGALALADSQAGRVLDRAAALGVLDQSMVVVMADHGEALGEQQLWGHGWEVYENIIRIPLIIYLPGIEPARVGKRVEAIDVMPTVLHWFGLERDDALEGRVLPLDRRWAERDAADLDALHEDRAVFSETWIKGYRKSTMLAGGWKLIFTQQPQNQQELELYAIDDDPGELDDLAADRPRERWELYVKLDEWKKADVTKRKVLRQSPAEIEMLRALGYLE